jgi:hypothetical protein
MTVSGRPPFSAIEVPLIVHQADPAIAVLLGRGGEQHELTAAFGADEDGAGFRAGKLKNMIEDEIERLGGVRIGEELGEHLVEKVDLAMGGATRRDGFRRPELVLGRRGPRRGCRRGQPGATATHFSLFLIARYLTRAVPAEMATVWFGKAVVPQRIAWDPRNAKPIGSVY